MSARGPPNHDASKLSKKQKKEMTGQTVCINTSTGRKPTEERRVFVVYSNTGGIRDRGFYAR